ncbi:MAG TPA: homoserine kinase [Candidatus Methylomirabilis sp.]|nr:homoserine kinase [Candidatus Methylomirabilis sp.]
MRVPASSANLGSGFDALALALALHNTVEMEASHRVSVTVEGEGAGRLDRGPANVVARGAALAFEAAGRAFHGATIHCVNRIPLSRGLGSSAAAWVAGLVGANALLGAPLDRDAIVTLAARAEGHPDNVAAAVLGGLAVSSSTDAGFVAVALPVPSAIRWVVLVPEIESSTRDARAVLPDTVPRADAVFNVQRVSLLLAALGTGRADLLPVAMDDRLHQPYRRRLFPWMNAVESAARAAGALGCVLSGAGSAILAAVQDPVEGVVQAMEGALHATGVKGRALVLAVDAVGAAWDRME